MIPPSQANSLDDYLALRYKIELIPDLPGCAGGGDTIAEALEMLEDAKRGWMSARLDKGYPIPAPTVNASHIG